MDDISSRETQKWERVWTFRFVGVLIFMMIAILFLGMFDRLSAKAEVSLGDASASASAVGNGGADASATGDGGPDCSDAGVTGTDGRFFP